jgi:hypothetical protein
MTIVPRTGPVSARVAFVSTSWYHRGKSTACEVSTPDTRSSLGAVRARDGTPPLRLNGLRVVPTGAAHLGFILRAP